MSAQASLPQQGRDDRKIHHHGRGVGEKKAPVTIEHSEAPGGKHEKSGTRKDDPDEGDSEVALFTVEARGKNCDQQRRAKNSKSNDDARQKSEESEDSLGKFARFALSAFGTEARIDRNK